MKSICRGILAAAALALSAWAQTAVPLQQRIAAIINRPEYAHSRFGMEIQVIGANEPVFALNAQQFFVAASTTKLLTEGTALALLGPDYRFPTRVYRTGPVDASGVLHGDLILVASGDPNLSNRVQPDGTLAFQNEDHAYDSMPGGAQVVAGDPLLVLRELAAQVAKSGINKVDGLVRVDVGLFPEGEREHGTGVVISPIAVNDNLIDVTILARAENSTPQLTLSPATSYVHMVSKLKTGPSVSGTPDITFTDQRQPDGTYAVTIQGTVPAGAKLLRTYRVPEPSRFAAMTFAEALKGAGVTAKADLNSPPPAPLAQPFYVLQNRVAEHISPPFSEEAKVTLKVSQNLHASMTPYIIGAIVGKNHADALQTGFDLERGFLKDAGLDLSSASQSDGEGGEAFFTPDFMVHYLIYYTRLGKLFPALFRGLPVMGKDGTLWDIQPDSPAAGHVHAKTGTFGDSDALNRSVMITGKGLAGYIDRKDGRRLAFAVYLGLVDGDPESVAHTAGNVLGEIATAAYDAPLE